MKKDGIRQWFSIGHYGVKYPENTGTLWRTAQGFGANYIFTIGERYRRQMGDTRYSYQEIPLFSYGDFESFKKTLPKACKLVGIEMSKRSVSLDKFKHPLRCVYLLGAEDNGLPPEIQKECDYIVEIPYSSHCLNVSLAGGLVMYDRINKIQQGIYDDHSTPGKRKV